jgi:hypothetical protein
MHNAAGSFGSFTKQIVNSLGLFAKGTLADFVVVPLLGPALTARRPRFVQERK